MEIDTPLNPTPKGKQEKTSLRELEQQIDGILRTVSTAQSEKADALQLYQSRNAQRSQNVRGESTQKQQGTAQPAVIERGLGLGARSIDTIKPSDAKEWACMKRNKGFSYNTINNHKRSLKRHSISPYKTIV